MPTTPKTALANDLGPCPFCGLNVAATISADEDRLYDGLLHELPMCVEFQAMEPDVFIRKMREALERQQTN